MKKLALACTPLLALVAVPAQAADIGTFGSSGFAYGTLTGSGFSAYTRYPAGASECLGLGDCARGNDTYAIIAASGTPGSLLVHPGPGAGGNSAVSYTAPTGGIFDINVLATSADQGAKSVGYFSILGGQLSVFTSGSIAGSASQAIRTTLQLGAGDSLGVFVNNGNGDYFYDSTRVSGSIAAVPEPATWGMMVLGFGAIGFGLRNRRRKTTATVRFA